MRKGATGARVWRILAKVVERIFAKSDFELSDRFTSGLTGGVLLGILEVRVIFRDPPISRFLEIL